MRFAEKSRSILPSTLLKELVPAVSTIAEELGVTEDQAIAICVFALVEQINPNPSNEPRQIWVRNSSDMGVIMMTRYMDRDIQISDTSRLPRVF